MHIAVLVKEVPDTFGARDLNLETGLVERSAGDPVLDEICLRAVEEALRIAGEAGGGSVHVFSMGPASAGPTIRKALAMGADVATHIVDEDLVGADATLTAQVLHAALKDGGFDLIVAGNSSTDGAGGIIPAMLAQHLNARLLGELQSIDALESRGEGGWTIKATRATDLDVQQLEAATPAVACVTEAFPDGRLPNFKGIMAAKKKPLNEVNLSALGIDAQDFSVARTIMTAVDRRPAKQAGVKIHDDGTAASQIVEFLQSNKLI